MPADLDVAVDVLRAGHVVAIPTDTVYGLAALPHAAGRLFELKRRPADVDLPVLVADLEQARSLATDPFPEHALALAHRYWPGALTLVVPRAPGFDADLGRHRETVGLRCPDHPVARALCARAGAIATTSANLHGEPPLTTAGAVAAVFGPSLLVVDGGVCDGIPSTVVDCTAQRPRLLRAGAIPWERLGGLPPSR